MTAATPLAHASRFTYCLVLINPASTHAEQGKKRVAELQKIYGDALHVVETPRGGVEAIARLLVQRRALLGSGTLLCIIAGDGTVNAVINALVANRELPSAARLTVVLPLWGGNANDLANMLNGTARHTSVHSLLIQGRVVRIRPLACSMRHADGGRLLRIAACYVSFGATAYAAGRLNHPAHRGRRLHRLPGGRMLGELYTSLKALADAPLFHITEHGANSLVYERTFANGPRFAKLDHLPAKLTEQKFYVHTITHKRLSAILGRIAGFIHKPGTAGHTPTRSTFTVQEETAAQFDGEPLTIPAGTRVTITLARRSFYTLSTQEP
jgi:hypothetical protein